MIAGKPDPEHIPLKRAPHTVEDPVGDWDRPDSREQGRFPPGALRVDKGWSSVTRIENVCDDRHLICLCPPLESCVEAAE